VPGARSTAVASLPSGKRLGQEQFRHLLGAQHRNGAARGHNHHQFTGVRRQSQQQSGYEEQGLQHQHGAPAQNTKSTTAL
jgi:hypothetical protein